MAQYTFGTGALWGTRTVDAAGAAIPATAQTPIKFGVLQSVNLELNAETKTLFGSRQFAEVVVRGQAEISVTAAAAQISGRFFNDLFFGQTLVAGYQSVVDDLTGAAIPATPFTITVTPPGGGTFIESLGVRFAATQIDLVRVASAPATGQYTVSAGGAYVFAAADTGQTVLISYRYSATLATAQRSTVANLNTGTAPFFRCDLYAPAVDGRTAVFTLPRCVSSKLSLSLSNTDFLIPNLEFSAFNDPITNSVLSYALSE